MIGKYIFQEVTKLQDYNPLAINPAAHFAQSFFYGEWQKKMGRKVRRFVILEHNNLIGCFQLVKYDLPFNKSYLYIPHGPVINNLNEKFLAEFRILLKKITGEEEAIFIRFDFFPAVDNKLLENICKPAPFYSYHSAFFQAKFDWVLNIDKPEEEILKEMHPKTRYNIRLAEKKGVKIEIVNGQEMEHYFADFYRLMQETAQRGGFGIHPKKYYEVIFESAKTNDNIKLFIAKHDNKVLAANLIIYFGQTAFYPFGGSSNEARNLMPTYLLHWFAIQEAKKNSLQLYNFGGIDIGQKVINESWEGITTFKKRFGGSVVEFGDFFDLVSQPLWCRLYNFRKKIKAV